MIDSLVLEVMHKSTSVMVSISHCRGRQGRSWSSSFDCSCAPISGYLNYVWVLFSSAGVQKLRSLFFLQVLERMWTVPEAKTISRTSLVDDQKRKDVKSESKDILGELSRTDHTIQTLDKTISNLEMELAAAWALQDSTMSGSPITQDLKILELTKKRKYLMVIGINTTFSSRKRRDSVRATWMPQGDKPKKLEEEKGIVIRFVIGHSATSGGILD
ncbi:putative beta-1,3-galactosyltransferase 4 isoform X2 [Nicotiana tabacum]|uniref:Beta-1,3-galactosyltransferase 4 isoform X2 n=1 Tax=Nicotiana tabacum TaxID=4097 RepID=A0AC58U185_TOBAC